MSEREFNGWYSGKHLEHIAFPLGGIGAGMICVEGGGSLSHFSLKHRPQIYNEPCIFAAIASRNGLFRAKVLAGPVASWKLYAAPGAANGAAGKIYGLRRFSRASFLARFPFAFIRLEDPSVPLDVEITAWSPFIPLDEDNSSLPVAALRYSFHNRLPEPVDLVFYFNAKNMFSEKGTVARKRWGFTLASEEKDLGTADEAYFRVEVPFEEPRINCRWFRGQWFDALTILWKQVEQCTVADAEPYDDGPASGGASVCVPFTLSPDERKTIDILLSWFVPRSNLRIPDDRCRGNCCTADAETARKPTETYRPWYAAKFENIDAVANYWRENYAQLYERSKKFSDTLFSSTLPPEALEALSANLSILKSPTILRQHDGRIWCWEGCCDDCGCCYGSCTHVWNYAQAIAHLFPSLERTLRQTEFHECQNEEGHQAFRAPLPIRDTSHDRPAACDGQLGGIMKVYRDWRITGDDEWLAEIWPLVKKSIQYCIRTWDPDCTGIPQEPHHNTYDIEFWGPDPMCGSICLGALKAAAIMAEHLNDSDAEHFAALYRRGRKYMEEKLWNGQYFYQQVKWRELKAAADGTLDDILSRSSPEERLLIETEGPKYQFGKGCLSDGVLGQWLAEVCGLGEILDRDKVKSHLLAVYRYNFRKDLSEHSNPQRSTYAAADDSGLLLCSWPQGSEPSIPFPYSNEVWTGIEYQVAGSLIMLGHVEEGLEIIRAVRRRYDGTRRNPFDEYECGHWYARALSSYGLLQAFSGAFYDAATGTLYIDPPVSHRLEVFICTATGYGKLCLKDAKTPPTIEVVEGSIPVRKIVRAKAPGGT